MGSQTGKKMTAYSKSMLNPRNRYAKQKQKKKQKKKEDMNIGL